MSSWINQLSQDIENLEKALSQVPLIQFGEATGSGWVYVPFPKVYASAPAVVAVQTPRSPTPSTQKLSPPQIPSPSLSPPQIGQVSLTQLQIQQPSPPTSWGQQAQQIISQYCSSTIGQVPVIGGYLCTAVDKTFGALAYYVANAIQDLYYAFDQKALISAIEQAVDYKVSQDINSVITQVQDAINSAINDINNAIASGYSDINGALSTLTSSLQTLVNYLYQFANIAYGLAEDLSIPVAQVRNVSQYGFEVYVPSGATVYWIAVG